MKKKLLLVLIVFMAVFAITGCVKGSNGSSSKTPSDAINSAVGVVKTEYGNYYLKEKLGSFTSQLTNENIVIGSTNGIDFKDLDSKAKEKTGNAIVTVENPKTMLIENFLKFDVRSENIDVASKNFNITGFNILQGTVTLNNKSVELDKTTIDEVVSILGEDNITSKNESLGLYTFKLNDYEWKTYRVYFENNKVVTNIGIDK